MMSIQRCFILLIGLMACLPLRAHEFWLTPPAAGLVAGDTAHLTLHVGEFFQGDLVGFSESQTALLRLYSASGSQDLRNRVPRQAVAALALPLVSAGTHLLAFDSQPNYVTLPAEKFHAYLQDEGLDAIKIRREAVGMQAQPARERYRRYVKTLWQVGKSDGLARPADLDAKDFTYSKTTGQRLEIIPLRNPLLMKPGAALGVRVLFEKKPLAGALVKAWHKHGDKTLTLRGISSADGTADFNLPYSGPWMISVVHMIPAAGDKDVEWDSLWGNLTFVLPSIRAAP